MCVNLSWYTDIDFWPVNQGLIPSRAAEFLSLLQCPYWLWAHQALCPVDTEFLLLGSKKRMEHETED
jgi:hypothetical protein